MLFKRKNDEIRATARVDAHQHFWRYNPSEYGWIHDSMQVLRRDFLPSDLKSELDSAGFSGCVVVQARQTVEETRWLLQLASAKHFISGVVGWVDLQSNQLHPQLQSLTKEPKLVGLRHIVQSEPDENFLLQPKFLRGISLLEEFDLAYDILIYPRHLPVAVQFVERFPRQRFVLDHIAKPPIKDRLLHPWTDGIRRLADFPNVFCKLSGLVTEANWNHWTMTHLTPYLDVAFECFGPDRLMFGSDWPVCCLAASYSRTVEVLEEYLAPQTAGVSEKVFGANVQKFYKLKIG